MATPSLMEHGLPGDHQRGARVHQRDIAIGALRAVQDIAQRFRIGLGLAALERRRGRAGEAGRLGREFKGVQRAPFQLHDPGRPGGGDLVEAIEAVGHPNALGAEIAQDFRHRFEPCGGEHADQLALDPGRIGERPEKIEQRARAEFDPRRPHVAHRGMMRRRHHEADPGLMDAAFDGIRRNPDLDAERGEGVGRARTRGRGAIAVLGDRHAAGGGDDRGERRDVERARTVAAGAHDIDRVRRRPDADHLGAHRRDRAGDFVDGLPAHPQRHEEPAHLRRGDFARQHRIESVFSLRPGEGRSRGDFCDQRLEGFISPFRVVVRALAGAGERRRRAPGNFAGSRGRARSRCSPGGIAPRTPDARGAQRS